MPRFLFAFALLAALIVTPASLLAQPRGDAKPTPPPPPPELKQPDAPAARAGKAADEPRAAADARAKSKAAEEEEEEDDDDDDNGAVSLDDAPFSAEQKAFLKKWSEDFKKRVTAATAKSAPPTFRMRWRAETYSKMLYQNDQSQGSVSLGTPNPKGDNYSGNNGFASELVLYVEGRVSNRVEVGARLKSRFHRQWADFYESGDLAVDETGTPTGADSTGESLGMNHAAYIQLRGLFVRMRPPIPTVKSFHIGSSDLSGYNAWTVGKVRYIDRDNANGIFLSGAIKSVNYHLARITLPKLYASAGWNSGIDDALVQNPFWTRDAAYVLKLDQQPNDFISWKLVSSLLLDEEADLNDPDAYGSTNFIDKPDGVVATLPRYLNSNTTLELQINKGPVDGNLMAGLSYSAPDTDYVFNGVDGNQGIFPVPMKEAVGYAIKARADIIDPFEMGLSIRVEYFNISEDWVATFGSRRENDALLTDGFVGGQTPTLNVANEFIDFRDDFYESIVGWHGFTISPQYKSGSLEAEAEFTFIEYNTDMQDRCVSGTMTNEIGNPIAADNCPLGNSGRPYGVYPTFLHSEGMTDTDFYTYANTNNRGRDPRSVYKQNQARRTIITMAKLGYQFDVGRGLRWELKGKYILDTDQRDQHLTDDDYTGHLIFARTKIGTQITDELNLSLGFAFDYWNEKHRSGTVVGGVAKYYDYTTWKARAFVDLKYQFGGATLAWYMEYLHKDIEASLAGKREDGLSDAHDYHNVVRGIGTVSTNF